MSVERYLCDTCLYANNCQFIAKHKEGATGCSAYINTFGVSVDRLREICEAERDGRLLVLPMPIGTRVYIVVRHGVLHDKILENVVCGYSESEWQGSLNKGKDSRFVICHNSYNMPSAYELRDVFLTRAEAEAALAGQEDKP